MIHDAVGRLGRGAGHRAGVERGGAAARRSCSAAPRARAGGDVQAGAPGAGAGPGQRGARGLRARAPRRGGPAGARARALRHGARSGGERDTAAAGRPLHAASGDTGIPFVDPDYAGDLARSSGSLELLGPLGRGYDLTGLDAAGTLLVAGGIGLTVLVDVPRLLGGRPRLVAGFRTVAQAEAAVPLVDADAEAALALGLVTGPLEAALAGGGVTTVLAAGPLDVTRAVAEACASHGVPARWRWRRAWPAASARATAAPSSSTARGSASASRGPWSTPRGCRDRAAGRAGARAPRRQRLGHPRRAGRARGARRRHPRLRGPRHEDHHPRAARRQPAAADRGGAGRPRELDRDAGAGRRGLPAHGPAGHRGRRRRAADRLRGRVRRGGLRPRDRGARR